MNTNIAGVDNFGKINVLSKLRNLGGRNILRISFVVQIIHDCPNKLGYFITG